MRKHGITNSTWLIKKRLHPKESSNRKREIKNRQDKKKQIIRWYF
jgi:hypothetical protein